MPSQTAALSFSRLVALDAAARANLLSLGVIAILSETHPKLVEVDSRRVASHLGVLEPEEVTPPIFLNKVEHDAIQKERYENNLIRQQHGIPLHLLEKYEEFLEAHKRDQQAFSVYVADKRSYAETLEEIGEYLEGSLVRMKAVGFVYEKNDSYVLSDSGLQRLSPQHAKRIKAFLTEFVSSTFSPQSFGAAAAELCKLLLI